MKTCSVCRIEKSETEFFERGDRPGYLRSNCKQCHRAGIKRWEENNPIAAAEIHKFKHILLKYGITKEVYEGFMADQEGRCAICRMPFDGTTGPKSPCVDHKHKTGNVRGLLCRHCNFAIGLANEDPTILEAMASYIRKSE